MTDQKAPGCGFFASPDVTFPLTSGPIVPMTQDRFPSRVAFRNAFIAGIFLLLLAACANDTHTTRGADGRRTTTVGVPQEGEESRPVAMMGEQKFFDGRINATVTVSQGLDGLARRGGWRTLGRTRAEAPELQDVFSRELGDPEKNDIGQTINKMVALQVMGSPLPPVMLRILLNNTSGEPAEVARAPLGRDAVGVVGHHLGGVDDVDPEGVAETVLGDHPGGSYVDRASPPCARPLRWRPMGQQIAVVAKPSSNPGVVRFEANRNLTGQGHEVFHSSAEAMGTRPAAVLARRLLDTGRVETVHVFGNMITVDVAKGFDASGLEDVVADLYQIGRASCRERV